MPDDCVECGYGAFDGAKAAVLTLDYSGAPGVVTIYRSNKVQAGEKLFEGFLNPGDRFTIDAATLNERDLGPKVGFYLGGVLIAEIHTSCSDVLRPGTTEANQEKGKDPNGVVDFTVVSGIDKNGNTYCVDDVCLLDQGPPEIMYSFDPDRFVVIDITDDTGIASIDITLEDIGGAPTPNLELVDSDFTPGAMTAQFRYRLINFTQNTYIRVVATDLCDQRQCPDTDQYPEFSPAVVINGQGTFATGYALHPDGLQSLEFFRLNNVAVTQNTFVAGNPQADFTLTRLDPAQNGTYGLIAATSCNATVIDPDLDYSGTGARGDVGMASFEVGSSLLDAMKGDGASSEAVETTLPGTFSVGQNYPNPFRASTTIGVELPEATEVLLEVYNLLGQRMAVVANGLYEAGSHAFSFDASELPSGTYIYRIVTPESSVARRMVVLN